jgi:hypothetical protein
MGRPWLAYCTTNLNQFGSLWVNFNSLLWDVFAISTYLSVSLVFWWTVYYLILRCCATNYSFNKRVYSILSFDGAVEQKIGNVLRKFLSSCWISYSFSTFCTYYCIDGFCYICNSWLAYNYISSLL